MKYENFIVKVTLWAFKGYLFALEVFSMSQHGSFTIKIPLGASIRERKIGLSKLILLIFLIMLFLIFMFFVV